MRGVRQHPDVNVRQDSRLLRFMRGAAKPATAFGPISLESAKASEHRHRVIANYGPKHAHVRCAPVHGEVKPVVVAASVALSVGVDVHRHAADGRHARRQPACALEFGQVPAGTRIR